MDTLPKEMDFQRALARSTMYKLLAKSFRYPTSEVFDFMRSRLYEKSLSELTSLGEQQAGFKDVVRAFKEMLSTWWGMRDREELESEYNRLFAHLGSAKCPPYETEYGYDNIFQKTEAMADISAFYRAYGLGVSERNTDRVDFIGTELEFMSYLAANEAYARAHDETEHLEICLDTQRKFLRDHLGRWVTVFSQVLTRSTQNPFYSQLGGLTEEFLGGESRRLGVELSKVAAPISDDSEPRMPFGCDGCLP